MIANAISTDKLVSTAVATNGSVANVNGIVGGSMESGFSQADVATWAYTGTGIWEGRGKVEDLRAIANLYPESVHLVVRKGLNVKSPGRPQGQARLARRAGLRHARQRPHHPRRLRRAGARHQAGVRQAEPGGGRSCVTVRSTPSSSPAAIRRRDHRAGLPAGGIELVPITGPEAAKLRETAKFFAADEIPAGTYKDIPAVRPWPWSPSG